MPTSYDPPIIRFTPIFYDAILSRDMLKPNKIKLVLALCIIVAGVWLTVVIVLKTQQSKGPAEILKQLPRNVDISLQKIHYTDIKDGEKRWDLVADKVEYDKRADSTHLKNIRMEFFSKGKKSGNIILLADRATYHNNSGEVEAEGKVTASNDAGMKVETSRLHYNPASSTITTHEHVKVTDGRLLVEGTGMELRLKEKNVRVLHQVTARIGGRAK